MGSYIISAAVIAFNGAFSCVAGCVLWVFIVNSTQLSPSEAHYGLFTPDKIPIFNVTDPKVEPGVTVWSMNALAPLLLVWVAIYLWSEHRQTAMFTHDGSTEDEGPFSA